MSLIVIFNEPSLGGSLCRSVRFFKGRSRIIRGKNEIKSARSAMDTKN